MVMSKDKALLRRVNENDLLIVCTDTWQKRDAGTGRGIWQTELSDSSVCAFGKTRKRKKKTAQSAF